MVEELSQLFKFAHFLADEARLISNKYFRQEFSIEQKENLSPVTIADLAIEQQLRQLIRQNYPTHGIIGEEFNHQVSLSEYCWVIDPIDGTVAFSCGKPTFTTLIALLKNGQPILGIIDQAISHERFSSWLNNGAWFNQQPLSQINQRNIITLSMARLNITTPLMFTSQRQYQCFTRLQKQVKLTAFGGDAYAFALLAIGQIDLILEANLQYYDVAAIIPLIKTVGGVISNWQGEPINLADFNGECLVTANQILHQQALTIINSF
ncbi:MAG: hypothetical protein RLZZ293_812 [Pseudomonadota bacterium]|jgi:histidinol phosphatase-like enzyme (inositol monophosphatase family)